MFVDQMHLVPIDGLTTLQYHLPTEISWILSKGNKRVLFTIQLLFMAFPENCLFIRQDDRCISLEILHLVRRIGRLFLDSLVCSWALLDT